jgi:hypothetical protein
LFYSCADSHFVTCSLDGVSGFKECELPSIFNCMRTALRLSEVTLLLFLKYSFLAML